MFSTSLELLKFHWMAYTIYAVMILSLIAWFAYGVTRKEKIPSKFRIPFYGYIGFLVAGGVGHHIFTYNTIPWVSEDIMRHDIKADHEYHIVVKDHKWHFPKEKMVAYEGEKVRFNVDSKDLTYGFGLFRKDGTMVFQMQVVPKHKNDILWTFNECGKFDLTSTEYSGPAQYDKESGEDKMFVKDAVIVECNKKVASK